MVHGHVEYEIQYNTWSYELPIYHVVYGHLVYELPYDVEYDIFITKV